MENNGKQNSGNQNKGKQNSGPNQATNQGNSKSSTNLPRTNAIDDVEINLQAMKNVENALEKYRLIEKHILYYILGPITYFDRELIKGLLSQGKKVKVFIQGGIEYPKPPPPNAPVPVPLPYWETSLAGIVPANAGMDYENFYGFFEKDYHENLSVYVQFTNMAKPGKSTNTTIKDLWLTDMDKNFIGKFKDSKRGGMFGKFWQYYHDITAGLPWQHDPIEVINSLFLLDDEKQGIIKKGRTCIYSIEKPDGELTEVQQEQPGNRDDNDKKIIAHLLDHKEENEDTYDKKQRKRFDIFKRLFMKSMKEPSRVVRGPRLDPSRLARFGQIENEIDALINRVMEYIQTTYQCIVSIEILDPDNSFAAELIKYISSNKADVYVHSQFYPKDITLKCKNVSEDPLMVVPSMVGFMDIPKKLLDDIKPLLKEDTSTETFKTIETKMIPYTIISKDSNTEDKVSTTEDKVSTTTELFFPLAPFIFIPPNKAKFNKDKEKLLMYGKTFGENKHPYMDCKLAELNFMKTLLGYERVFEGQPLYGYRDSDFTFSARGLVHPCTQFNKTDFINNVLDRKKFVNETFLSLSNTTGIQRISILNAWEKNPVILGGRSKRRTKKQKRTKKHRRINHKSRKR